MPHKESERVIAFVVAEEMAGKKADGLTTISTKLEITNKASQIIFIIYFYEQQKRDMPLQVLLSCAILG